jgi:hypothetical protein
LVLYQSLDICLVLSNCAQRTNKLGRTEKSFFKIVWVNILSESWWLEVVLRFLPMNLELLQLSSKWIFFWWKLLIPVVVAHFLLYKFSIALFWSRNINGNMFFLIFVYKVIMFWHLSELSNITWPKVFVLNSHILLHQGRRNFFMVSKLIWNCYFQ